MKQKTSSVLLDQRNSARVSPLAACIIHGTDASARVLLNNGADVHLPSFMGLSSIHLSCMCISGKAQGIEMAKLLLARGANVNDQKVSSTW